MTRHIVAIDQGTTSTRAILFDEAGKPLGVRLSNGERVARATSKCRR